MYDHPVSRDYNKSVSCDGCQNCPDVDYLSEDTDDSYFLDDPYVLRRGFRGDRSECLNIENDEFENSYNLSPLFEPDLYPDFYRNDDLFDPDDW